MAEVRDNLIQAIEVLNKAQLPDSKRIEIGGRPFNKLIDDFLVAVETVRDESLLPHVVHVQYELLAGTQAGKKPIRKTLELGITKEEMGIVSVVNFIVREVVNLPSISVSDLVNEANRKKFIVNKQSIIDIKNVVLKTLYVFCKEKND